MTAAHVEFLRDAQLADHVERLVPYDAGRALAIGERLRRDMDPDRAAWVMTQADLRTRARRRLGEASERLWWTADGVEQATRPEVARRHAQLLKDAGATVVADVGCGVGLDSLAFASAGLRVVAIEIDPWTAEVARANVEREGVHDLVTVLTADAHDASLLELGCDAFYLDPARRADGRRINNPEDWSPPLSTALQWAESVPSALLKLAPGSDRALARAGATFEAVSVDGSMVEVALRLGRAAGAAPFAAVMFPGPAVMVGQEQQIDVAPIDRWVIEVDDAIMRAGLLGQLAAELDAHLIDPHLAYLSAANVEPDRRYARFEVDEVLPFSIKALRAALRDRDVGRVEIKKRAFAADPEHVRRGLKLEAHRHQERVVLLTRLTDRPVAIIAWRR